jgi:hypothetical protein
MFHLHIIYKVAKEKIYISMTSMCKSLIKLWWGQVRAGIIAAITDLQQGQVAGRSEYLTLALTF